MAGSKVCFKCKEEKPIDEFYRHSGMGDGRLGKCKSCTKSDAAEHRAANLEKIRAYDRARAKIPERAKAAAAVSASWRKTDPRIQRCHSAVARALRAGRLQHRPCEHVGCGREDSYAHHEDYNRPLDVVFLCQPHHKARHAEMKRLGIDPINRPAHKID